MDELAFRLDLNPLELRRRNFAVRDPYHQRDWSSNRLLDCYERGGDAFGWPRDMPRPRSMQDGDVLVGYGMATTAYPAPALPATVRLRVNIDGPLIVETSATDIGTGMYTILAQTVADMLSHPFEDIEVRLAIRVSRQPLRLDDRSRRRACCPRPQRPARRCANSSMHWRRAIPSQYRQTNHRARPFERRV